jgi:chromosome partitioning protein
LGCRQAGILTLRQVGYSPSRQAGSPVYRHAELLEHQHADESACRHADQSTSRLTGMPTSRQCFVMQRTTPILAFASTKGGVGKTTLAFCLATEFARRIADMPTYRPAEVPVVCVDADPNHTLYQAISTGRPAGVAVEVATGETLLPVVSDASRRGTLVLIDLEGSANQAMLYACGKASLVLIPAQPSMFDVVEALKTLAVVEQASDLTGRKILTSVVLSRMPVLRQRVADHSRKQFVERGLPLLKCELMERTAFRTMTFTGKPPAEEDPEGGAAQNVAAITDEVAGLIGLTESAT